MTVLLFLAAALQTAMAAPTAPAAASPPTTTSAAPVVSEPAAEQPQSVDSRIRLVPYHADTIVEVRAALGYQLMIEFAPDERIENVAIGDSLGWQITPNRKANLLFVKPMDKVPVTNMTVVTNLRTYLFEMIPDTAPARRGDRTIVYALQFTYPSEKSGTAAAEPPPSPPPPQVVNGSYSYTGSIGTLPTRVFDDGRATYFQFHDGEEYPAIFAADNEKGEALVNSTIRGGYVVVDTIARGFTLRRGADVTHIYNDGFREPTPGPLSPVPRKVSCTSWICL